MTYRQRQHAVLPFIFFVAISLFVVIMSLAYDGRLPLVNLLLVLIGILVLLFSRLTDIAGARTLQNKWYYGLGIRLIPNGWMYNVWGLDAVEVDLVSGKVFRIGTAEPEALLAAINLYASTV